jgi:hypothetical protein
MGDLKALGIIKVQPSYHDCFEISDLLYVLEYERWGLFNMYKH